MSAAKVLRADSAPSPTETYSNLRSFGLRAKGGINKPGYYAYGLLRQLVVSKK